MVRVGDCLLGCARSVRFGDRPLAAPGATPSARGQRHAWGSPVTLPACVRARETPTLSDRLEERTMIKKLRTENTTYYTYSYTGLILGFLIWFLTSAAWFIICIFGSVKLGRVLAELKKHPYPLLYQNGGALPRGTTDYARAATDLPSDWSGSVRIPGSGV